MQPSAISQPLPQTDWPYAALDVHAGRRGPRQRSDQLFDLLLVYDFEASCDEDRRVRPQVSRLTPCATSK